MRKGKKLLAGVLALLLVLTCVPVYDMEVKAAEFEDFEYEVNDDGKSVTIIGYQGKNGGEVTIPSEIDGKSVTGIGSSAFESYYGLTTVTIPSSVTSIGWWAFSGCSGLTSVTIPSSVTSIGWWAFSGCSGLTSVTIPSSVTGIGDRAFEDCSGLTSVTIPSSVTSIGDGVFSGCSSLTDIKVEAGNKIYDSRGDCNAIIETASNILISGCKNTTIPSNVTGVEYWAFSGCSGLTSVTIPSSVMSIGDGAFEDCSGLTSVTIPSSVTSIGDFAFAYCCSLTDIKVEAGNTIYDSRGDCNAIIETASNILISGCKNTTIPSNVTGVGYWAFSGCSGLTSVTIPSSVRSIGAWAFGDCSGLTSVTIPSSETSIGDGAFYGCSSLASVTIPSNVTSIGKEAFGYCEIDYHTIKVLDFTIYGNSGTAAETYAKENEFTFRLLSEYNPSQGEQTKTDISQAVMTLEKSSYIYDGTAKTPTVTVTIDGKTLILDMDYTVVYSNNINAGTANVTVIGKGDYTGSVTGTFTITQPAGDYDVEEYVYEVNDDGNSVTIIEYKGNGGKITVPSEIDGKNVTGIGDRAFWLGELTSVTIPEGVIGIGDSAFFNQRELTSVTIPSSVRSIGDWAFACCSGLTSVTIPEGVTRIGDSVFLECSGLTSVAIPSSVTSIEDFAFDDCSSLTSVTIPSSVMSIGNRAFGYRDIDNDVIKVSGFTIYGDSGTAAETYAKENGFTFQSLSEYDPSQGEQTKTDISQAVMTLEKSSYIYDGTAKTPTVTVTIDGKTLIPDKDYTVVYSNNINAGTANVTVIGQGDYTGSVKGTFTITQPVGDYDVEEYGYEVNDDGKSVTITKYKGKGGEVTIPSKIDGKSVTGIGSQAFSGSVLTSVTIPSSVTDIGDSAFFGQYKLTSVTIPSSVTSVGDFAFGDCSGLTSVTISEGVTRIGDSAFSHCSGLTSVTIPEGVTRIGDCVFNHCSSLTSVTIPRSVTSISDAAFDDNGNLVIRGYKGSYAQTYAQENNITFKEINSASTNTGTGGNTGTGTNTGTGSNTGTGTNINTTSTVKVAKPAAPKISSLTVKNNGVTIKWGKVKKATGYYVYRKSEFGSWEKIATIKKSATTSYTDKKATNGELSQYRVYAYKTSGKTTAKSSASAAKKIVYLKAPKLSSVKNKKTTSAKVEYSINSSASGYQICYSTSSSFANGNKNKKFNDFIETIEVLKNLKKGKKYYVRVRAYSKRNGKTYYSAWSNKKSVKITK